jgi:branched-chain amino acid transport system ATP-binding protein
MAEPLLAVERLEAGYGGAPVLRGVGLAVHPGEAIALGGPNGAGKSTTLRTIAGLVRPTAGSVRFRGERIDGEPPSAIARRGLRLVPEGRRVFPTLTVKENLLVGGYLGWERARLADRIEECLTLFPPLRDRLRQRGGTLSGGEQQMLAIARALMGDPALLLLDEPSLGLAPQWVEEVFTILQRIVTQGVALLLVEQNALLALGLAERGYLLEGGEVRLTGRGGELLRRPEIARAYLGG